MNTDLTDAEWALVADLFERDGKRGASPRFERRTMVNACCYALRTGCAWRLLPKSFPPWQAVYMSFKRWGNFGVFEVMHDWLRQQWRDRIGKAPEPTAAIIDAQSTRSTAQGGNTGFDAGKKVKGRKRVRADRTLTHGSKRLREHLIGSKLLALAVNRMLQ